MADNYKANKAFSFGNMSYVEGQEVNIEDKNAIEKLKAKKLISTGKGKTAVEVQEERDAELQKESEETAKLQQEKAQKEFDRVYGEKRKSAGPNAAPPDASHPPKVSTIKTDDQTKK